MHTKIDRKKCWPKCKKNAEKMDLNKIGIVCVRICVCICAVDHVNCSQNDHFSSFLMERERVFLVYDRQCMQIDWQHNWFKLMLAESHSNLRTALPLSHIWTHREPKRKKSSRNTLKCQCIVKNNSCDPLLLCTLNVIQLGAFALSAQSKSFRLGSILQMCVCMWVF